MKLGIKDYAAYFMCFYHVKGKHFRLRGELQRLSTHVLKWERITMDFVVASL